MLIVRATISVNERHETMTAPHKGDFVRYYQMPKDFVGPQQADVLFMMSERMRGSDAGSYLYAAGSAAAESGIIALETPAEIRHERIDNADRTWRDAQDAFIHKNMYKGWTESKLLAMPDRIEMHRLYIQLYHEMVDGCVTERTLGRLHHDLIGLSAANLAFIHQADTTTDDMAQSARVGLNTELCKLMTMTRLNCPSLFPIPAISRADHGGYFPKSTHDVRLLQQSWGAIKWCVPYEVKSNDSGRKGEYDSAFVRGKVELRMPFSTDALDLSWYMREEEEGTISPEQLTELNNITSRIMGLAVDYRRRQKLASSALAVA